MKKINLKRAIQLPNAQKTILRPGIHNVQDDVFSHWFIQGMITKGDIVVMDDIAKPNVLQSTNKPVTAEVKPQSVLQKVGPAVSQPLPQQVEVEEILPKSKQVELDFEPAPPEKVEEPVEEASVVEKVEEPVVTEEAVEKPKKIVRRKKKN